MYLIIAIFFSFYVAGHALVFDIDAGRVKCLTEELTAGEMSVASFRIPDNNKNHNISARLMDPKGEELRRVEAVDSNQMVFVAGEEGKYSVCFWSPIFRLDEAVTVDFEWKNGVVARDWRSVAKKDKIEVMEVELKKLESTVNSIHQEMIFLRTREVEAELLIENTVSRMNLLNLLSFLVCIGVVGLQLWHLKTFFVRKKIL